GPQGSGILRSMTLANGLIIVPEDISHIQTGAEVTVQFFDSPEVD
ncbi:MAG: molybdopterin molybdenumtransferase MoeA, partial [Candidatus Poribacteria bacterium]